MGFSNIIQVNLMFIIYVVLVIYIYHGIILNIRLENPTYFVRVKCVFVKLYHKYSSSLGEFLL